MADRHIAIIGGGASAALVLVHLAQGDVAGWTVDVYDSADRFGLGVAYSTNEPCHLLNVRAANMSAFEGQKDDFEIWAREFGYGAMDFAPRPLYGLYIAQRMHEAMTKFSSVQFLSADALGSRKVAEGRYDVTTVGGHKTYTDVIVATGNVKPLAPKVEGNVAAYHPDPWGVEYAALKNLARVVLIGTGLSAVDAIQSLVRAGYTGTIATVSRNGLFPAVHVPPAAYPAFAVEGLSPSSLMKRLRDHVEQFDGPWQAVVDSLRPSINAVWQGWTEGQRSIFLRRALTHWNIHRHRMAPENAAVIQTLRDEGRVITIKDKVVNVTVDGVVCAHQTVQADAIINCMGYRYDEGRVFESTYRIGPARFGELFETTAIPEIRAQAQEIVKILTQ